MGLKVASFLVSSKEVPGSWSLALFLKGCNLRCRHCYNWRLVTGKELSSIEKEDLIREARSLPFLEFVVISGGEPTVSPLKDLIDLICRIKVERPDLKVRVDTNGTNPEVLKALKDVVDGFAVDIKSPLQKPDLYSYTAGSEVDVKKIMESIELADGMPLTIYRTPKYPWLGDEDFDQIRKFTSGLRSPWFLNDFFEVPDCPFNLL